MATRRTAPDPARAERTMAPLQGLELARARAWVQERPNAGPPRISAAALADQLKAQAAEHGMADFALSASTADEAMERQQAEEDEEALKQRAEMESFAGLRPPDEGAAENPEVVALFAAQPGLVESAQQLATGGAAALKAELERLGLKCGGTCEERAARLFSSALSLHRTRASTQCVHVVCAQPRACRGRRGRRESSPRSERGPVPCPLPSGRSKAPRCQACSGSPGRAALGPHKTRCALRRGRRVGRGGKGPGRQRKSAYGARTECQPAPPGGAAPACAHGQSEPFCCSLTILFALTQDSLTAPALCGPRRRPTP